MPFLSRRTKGSLKFDFIRCWARLRHQTFGRRNPPFSRLHFGCGRRHIAGWTNVDVTHSPYDIDLSAPLPWPDAVFDTIASQQVIEHLALEPDLMPLMRELHRVAKPDCEIWLSTPDLAKVCAGYMNDRGIALLADRQTRYSFPLPARIPSSQIVNILFHQGNEHRNLFDFDLLQWLLNESGFTSVTRRSEREFLARFPEFPARHDDYHGIYVSAKRSG